MSNSCDTGCWQSDTSRKTQKPSSSMRGIQAELVEDK